METKPYYPSVRRPSLVYLALADIRCATAITKLIEPILIRNGLPGAAAALVCGDIDVGKELVGSEDIPLGTSMTWDNSVNQVGGADDSELHRK